MKNESSFVKKPIYSFKMATKAMSKKAENPPKSIMTKMWLFLDWFFRRTNRAFIVEFCKFLSS